MTRPMDAQGSQADASPLIRRASALARQTQVYRRTGYDGVPLALQHRQPPVSHAPPDAVEEEEEDTYDDQWPTRLPTSTRRYAPPVPQAAHYQAHPDQVLSRRQRGQANRARPPDVLYAGAAQADQRTTRVQPGQQKSFFRRAHPLLWIGLGMFFMLGAWVAWQTVSSWWIIHLDDATYGRPRTYQVDAVVGHNDSASHPSHFLAVNLHARVVVIELPGGDTTKAKIYQGPQIFGTNAELDPVTLTFADVNHDGKPDMLLHVQGATIIYLNQNGQFVPQPVH